MRKEKVRKKKQRTMINFQEYLKEEHVRRL
jgi:hypothetical protein